MPPSDADTVLAILLAEDILAASRSADTLPAPAPAPAPEDAS